MSVVVGEQVPDYVAGLFDGSDLEDKIGRGYLLVTVDASGMPRPCMLSAGEILVTGPNSIRLGLWTGSSTSRNLSNQSDVLLCIVDEHAVLYVRGRAQPLVADEAARLDCFELRVDRVESDAHEGLPVSGGITFTVVEPSPPELLEMWRSQLAAISAAVPAA